MQGPKLLLLQAGILTACMLLGNALTWGVGRWAIGAGRRWGTVSHVSERSSHAEPTSRLGGVALAVGILFPCIIFTTTLYFMPRNVFAWGANLTLANALLTSAALFFIVGLADDVWDLPVVTKFAGQLLALVPVFAFEMRFISIELIAPPLFPPLLFSMLLAAGWILFFVNAFNFMDGMDGFAIRFVISVTFWLCLIVMAKSLIHPVNFFVDLRAEFLCLAIIGAAASGFYRLNYPPAKLFMGDGGSHLLGFILGVQVLLADGEFYTSRIPQFGPGVTMPPAAVWILLLPFTFDVLLTLVRRASRRENLLAAHRTHLYQRLLITGMSHRDVLRLNIRYFQACGLLAALYAFSGMITIGAEKRLGLGSLTPFLHNADLFRIVLLGLALAAMIHYWRGVVRREREASNDSSGEPNGDPKSLEPSGSIPPVIGHT